MKYHKFVIPQVNDETKSDKPQKKSKNKLIGVLLVVIFVASICALFVTIGLAVGLSLTKNSESVPTPNGDGLTVLEITQEELQGEYRGLGGGILFQSTMNETFFTLSIIKRNGETLVIILHPLASNMTMMSVNNTNFMVMENQPGRAKYDGYVVPIESMSLLESILMHRREMSDEVYRQLDNKTVNETLQSEFRSLTMSEEALLIIEAAEALGSLGVRGSDYPAVMRFYFLALQLAKARANEEDANSDWSSNTELPKESRQKRATRCTSNGHICRSNPCPYRQGRNNCFGMCGRGCDCWSVVCGDCCVHEYCRSHDQCCQDRGFFSYACLSVAWRVFGSSCSEVYDC